MTAEPLPAALRRDRIAALVQERGFIRVAELSRIFRTSPVTIRTDLDDLEGRQVVRRVHGGAVPAGGQPAAATDHLEDPTTRVRHQLAEATAARLQPGQTVVLAGAPATRLLARTLAARTELDSLAVVTNDLQIALELQPRLPGFSVVLTGGTLRAGAPELGDPLGGALLADLSAELSIVGCAAVSAARGLGATSIAEVEMARRLLRAGEHRIVVADGEQVGGNAPARVAPADELDQVVTSPTADPEELAALRARGVAVALAPAAPAGATEADGSEG